MNESAQGTSAQSNARLTAGAPYPKMPWRYRFPSAQSIAWWSFAALCVSAAAWLFRH